MKVLQAIGSFWFTLFIMAGLYALAPADMLTVPPGQMGTDRPVMTRDERCMASYGCPAFLIPDHPEVVFTFPIQGCKPGADVFVGDRQYKCVVTDRYNTRTHAFVAVDVRNLPLERPLKVSRWHGAAIGTYWYIADPWKYGGSLCVVALPRDQAAGNDVMIEVRVDGRAEPLVSLQEVDRLPTMTYAELEQQ